ncbi:MAG: hypothetical protein OEV06_01920 [Anaerolineae bacterium]|nr:hypothetical protein [Anaerolineae bacterium]
MNKKTIESISNKVAIKFPEIAGKAPNVKRRPQAKSISPSPTYLFTYKGEGTNPSGHTIPRQVRVVVDESGKILKISTSR